MKTKFKILNLINEFPGISFKELSYFLSLSKGAISLHLKVLEEDGLIKKYLTNENKNTFRLHPTVKGKNLYLENKLKNLIKTKESS